MIIHEKLIRIERPIFREWEELVCYYRNELYTHSSVVRFVVAKNKWTTNHEIEDFIEIGIVKDQPRTLQPLNFATTTKQFEKRHKDFNIVFIIPTGINARIGGHSGDGGAVARLFSSCCDNFITHPNVVNASDINELPENGWYVEGSVLSRFLMGTIGLRRPRANRICVLVKEHEDEVITNYSINAINAARANMGINISVVIKAKFDMESKILEDGSGRAVGRIDLPTDVIRKLEECRNEYDVVAVTSPIYIDENIITDYFTHNNIVNPWGGCEAMLTHTLSSLLNNIQTAHSPMAFSRLEFGEIGKIGAVDPTKAAESVSVANLHCILKGLHRAPLISRKSDGDEEVLSVRDIDCIVSPVGCAGIPLLSAGINNIPVIMVEENTNLMKNDMKLFPPKDDIYYAKNYLEALGIVCAIKAGISLDTIKRPIKELRFV